MSTFNSCLGKIQALTACLALVAAWLSPTPASASIQALRPSPAQTSCNWNRPGIDPFMGDVVGAVDRYSDIPADVRTRLKERMARRDYDDLVSIRRDQIVGDHGQPYNPAIRDMHFGDGQVCHTVSREAWTPAMQERGLVYCESGHCILVPTVCRNVSRIARRGVAPEQVAAAEAPFAALPPAAGAVPAAAGAPGGERAGPLGMAGPFGLGTAAPLGMDGGGGAPSFGSAAAGDAVGPLGVPGGTASRVRATDALGASFGGQTTGDLQPTATGAAFVSNSTQPPLAAAIPEPSTWASMIVGLIGLGVACRRRLTRQVTRVEGAR